MMRCVSPIRRRKFGRWRQSRMNSPNGHECGLTFINARTGAESLCWGVGPTWNSMILPYAARPSRSSRDTRLSNTWGSIWHPHLRKRIRNHPCRGARKKCCKRPTKASGPSPNLRSECLNWIPHVSRNSIMRESWIFYHRLRGR